MDTKELRKAAVAIYAAIDEQAAKHISTLLLEAAQRIEELELEIEDRQDTEDKLTKQLIEDGEKIKSLEAFKQRITNALQV